VIDEVERAGMRIESIDVSQEAERRRLALDVRRPPEVDPAQVVARVADVEHVAAVRWSE
jgi:hypothetical protein